MSKDQTLTFEDVNNHVEEHFNPQQQTALAADGGGICSIYPVVKPILVLITQVIFIPQKWRDAVKILISSLDLICPGN